MDLQCLYPSFLYIFLMDIEENTVDVYKGQGAMGNIQDFLLHLIIPSYEDFYKISLLNPTFNDLRSRSKDSKNQYCNW